MVVVNQKGNKFIVDHKHIGRDGKMVYFVKSLGPKFLKKNGEGREFLAYDYWLEWGEDGEVVEHHIENGLRIQTGRGECLAEVVPND